MSDPGAADDTSVGAIQAPDISPDFGINPDDPTFHAPSIMGGVDLSGADLPMLSSGQGQVPWTVQSGGVTPALPSFAGGSSQPPDQAKGVGTALDTAGTMVDGVHSAIRQAAATMKADPAMLTGLKGVQTALTTPLTIGSGVADTVSQINHGASPSAAILGNSLRTAAILGAGTLGEMAFGPLGAVGASSLAGKVLPDGTTIGNDVVSLFH